MDTTEPPFNFEDKLKLMRESTDKRMKIIALYWSLKGWKFQNALQYSKALKRELRCSQDLLGYNSEQITTAMQVCNSEFDMWSLETLSKRIEDIVL